MLFDPKLQDHAAQQGSGIPKSTFFNLTLHHGPLISKLPFTMASPKNTFFKLPSVLGLVLLLLLLTLLLLLLLLLLSLLLLLWISRRSSERRPVQAPEGADHTHERVGRQTYYVTLCYNRRECTIILHYSIVYYSISYSINLTYYTIWQTGHPLREAVAEHRRGAALLIARKLTLTPKQNNFLSFFQNCSP